MGRPKEYVEGQWNWMMDWCKDKGLAPGDSAVWHQAEDEYWQVVRDAIEKLGQPTLVTFT
jgi:hypothetical protein